ncbi:MAG: ABC transporter ATP-binding protein, partial [Nocardioides sp.]
LGLVVAVTAFPIVALSNRFERQYVLVSRRVQDEQGDLATLAEEGAVGIRVIKSFGRGRFVAEGYDEAAQTLYDSSMDKVRLAAKFWTFLEMIPNLAVVVVLLLGAYGVGTGALTLGTLVAFITLMLSLVWPVAALGYILAMGQEAMTAAARILEIFDTQPSITSGSTVLEAPRGHLRLEGVGFAFPDLPDEPVLRDVNLDVAPGETVAVVGATGSGKTVLTSLVPRLYDVTAGRVTVDGIDVRDLELGNLRQIVATAFEEPTLFSMSARENLLLGRHDATEAELLDAVEVAQAQFVHDLPWGLDTRIGEQGMSLSGGQRQRLALARAVLSRPRILVLDDTLSALDVHTEKLVESALRRVLADATGIVVAHRASTVLLADKVALLQDGTITHVGDHRELLATVPAYRELLAADAESDADLEGASA